MLLCAELDPFYMADGAQWCSLSEYSYIFTQQKYRIFRVRLFATLWTIAHQAPLSMGFSKQEYWSGLPLPTAGDLPDPGIETKSLVPPALADRFFTTVRMLVSQLCLTLCNPMVCSPPESSVHGMFQARILEWVAMPTFTGSSQPRGQTQVFHIAGRFFTI